MRIRKGSPLKNEVPDGKRRWDEATLNIRDYVMLTSIRGLTAATFALSAALVSVPAMAQDEAEASSDITVTGNVALVTDYRFRGVSLSGGDPAIQGGLTVSHSSGFYVGTWASSIQGGGAYGEMELDVFGGWAGDLTEGLSLDVGILQYMYPTDGGNVIPGDDTTYLGDYNVNYWEPYAKLSTTFGPAKATLGVAYAWDQSSLGDEDNLYIFTDLGGGIPDTPISLSAHLGYTDGVLAPSILAGGGDDTGLDWSIGASATVLGGLTFGVSYVGVEGPSVDGFTDDTVVGTLSYSF